MSIGIMENGQYKQLSGGVPQSVLTRIENLENELSTLKNKTSLLESKSGKLIQFTDIDKSLSKLTDFPMGFYVISRIKNGNITDLPEPAKTGSSYVLIGATENSDEAFILLFSTWVKKAFIKFRWTNWTDWKELSFVN